MTRLARRRLSATSPVWRRANTVCTCTNSETRPTGACPLVRTLTRTRWRTARRRIQSDTPGIWVTSSRTPAGASLPLRICKFLCPGQTPSSAERSWFTSWKMIWVKGITRKSARKARRVPRPVTRAQGWYFFALIYFTHLFSKVGLRRRGFDSLIFRAEMILASARWAY